MGISEQRYGYVKTPTVSASQIAEYIGGASPTRRRTIIQNARFPPKFIVAQYDKAREGIVNFLVDGTRRFDHLAATMDHLTRRGDNPKASNWVRKDCRSSIEAIEAFQRGYNKLGFPKLDCKAVAGRLPHLDEWPTRIRITMDLTIHKPSRVGPDHFGGAIFLFSRGETSTNARRDRTKTVAGLIYTYCDRILSHMGEPDPTLCMAVDVFGGIGHKSPGTFVRKLTNIEHACEEIAVRWRSIAPPNDYDGPDPS